MNKAFDKIVNRFKQLQGCDSLANMFISDVIKVIKSIEKEYNNGWIPCSERLPEEHKLYDITFKNSAGKKMWKCSMSANTSSISAVESSRVVCGRENAEYYKAWDRSR